MRGGPGATRSPKKKRGRVPAYTPALRQRRLELGVSRASNCRSGSGGRTRCALAAAIRVDETEAPIHPSTGPEVAPRGSYVRPERRDSKDAMQGGPTPGGRGPRMEPRRTFRTSDSLSLRLHASASGMPRMRVIESARFDYGLRPSDHGSIERNGVFGRVDSTIDSMCSPSRPGSYFGDATSWRPSRRPRVGRRRVRRRRTR